MLDFSIRGARVRTTEYVGLPDGPHGRMVVFAQARGLPLVHRMVDYYGDASYTVAECPLLLMELRAIEAAFANDAEVQQMIRAMYAVLATAQERGLAVDVIAD